MLYTETPQMPQYDATICNFAKNGMHFSFSQERVLFRNLGNKKPHGEKEVKPWGNKRRLRFTSRDLKVLKIAEKFNRF